MASTIQVASLLPLQLQQVESPQGPTIFEIVSWAVNTISMLRAHKLGSTRFTSFDCGSLASEHFEYVR